MIYKSISTNCDWNILLVDDDEEDYIIVNFMLEKVNEQRIHLDWAGSYGAAIKKLKKQDWTAVLVDVGLGGRDGIQLIREAVSMGVYGPFIIVTGRGDRENEVEAIQAGASEYVLKWEMEPALLYRVICNAIERQSSQQKLSGKFGNSEDLLPA